jgi:hypothetical protein
MRCQENKFGKRLLRCNLASEMVHKDWSINQLGTRPNRVKENWKKSRLDL